MQRLPMQASRPHSTCHRRTVDLEDAPVFQTYCAELSAPQATAVNCQQRRGNAHPECRPVSAHDSYVSAFSSGHIEPWHVPFRKVSKFAFMPKIHAPVACADAQARHCIHDDSQPVPSLEALVPAIGLIAIPLVLPEPLDKFSTGNEITNSSPFSKLFTFPLKM